MENWFGVCLVLLSITGFCKAAGSCSVPDTKKSYVTNLAINMGRSVGICVPPDPSVLLALNLGKVMDPTAQDILIKQLKKDAVDRVSKNQTFTSGKVALYVLALRSSCIDPSSISDSGITINLVEILEDKTRAELQAFGNEPLSPDASVRTTWYQVGLDVLALSVMSRPYAFSAGEILAKHISTNVHGSVDTAAIAAMGLAGVLGMENVPENTFNSAKATLINLLDYILTQENGGLLGNAYSTGLAGQALIASEVFYPLDSWNCSGTIQKVTQLIAENTYSMAIAAAQVLPLMWGTSYVSVKCLPCLNPDVPLISVEFTVVNEIVAQHFQHSIIVQVREGSTLLEVMQKAAELNPTEFSFESENSSWGPYITSISHLAGNTNDKTYWQFFSGNKSLELGVGSYKPQNTEHISAIFSYY